jgi:hypothetical protein
MKNIFDMASNGMVAVGGPILLVMNLMAVNLPSTPRYTSW